MHVLECPHCRSDMDTRKQSAFQNWQLQNFLTKPKCTFYIMKSSKSIHILVLNNGVDLIVAFHFVTWLDCSLGHLRFYDVKIKVGSTRWIQNHMLKEFNKGKWRLWEDIPIDIKYVKVSFDKIDYSPPTHIGADSHWTIPTSMDHF